MAPGLLDVVHLTTWAVCAVIKLPQLVAVLRAGSAWGLSVTSLLLELAGLLVFLRYQIYYDYPLETYLEYPIIIAQDAILLCCIMHFSGKKRRALFYAVMYPLKSRIMVYVACLVLLCIAAVSSLPVCYYCKSFSGTPQHVFHIDMLIAGITVKPLQENLCTLVSAASKLVQLQHLWQTKDSGHASALTWGMGAYTCATRIITTVMTTNDLAVLIRFITMLILNIWVTATILHYRKTKKTD